MHALNNAFLFWGQWIWFLQSLRALNSLPLLPAFYTGQGSWSLYNYLYVLCYINTNLFTSPFNKAEKAGLEMGKLGTHGFPAKILL
jgi:hypothetical protein